MSCRPSLIRGFVFVVFLVIFYYLSARRWVLSGPLTNAGGTKTFSPERNSHESLLLSEGQCRVAFPLLTKEIDDAVAVGPFQFNRSVDDYTGQVHCRIRNQRLLIISASDRMSQEMAHERDATLSQIQRAIYTSPIPLPDITFTISALDTPGDYVWSFARSSMPNDEGKGWVMPHFSFWSWPKSFIGTIDQALANTERVEREWPWDKKTAKAVWRGSVHFNSEYNLDLRPKMLRITKGKLWADAQDMNWENNGMTANNSIAIHDFCRYKYILYTEGKAYSGRLPFHQACESVILTPPPNFLLHNTHLMRPLFSTSLGLSSSTRYDQKADTKSRWPQSYLASEANIVFVDPKWQDLEETIMYLESHQDLARGIAQRQRETFVKAGYLSPAAEVCYWRSLIRGWSSVARIKQEDWKDAGGGDGMRWETFSLKGTMDKNAV